MRRVIGFGWLAAASIVMTGIGPTRAQPGKERVEAAIAWVKAEERPDRDGVATISDGNKYVQCRGAKGSELRCEAAGALMQVSMSRVLTPERIGWLTAMGWKLDASFGNYVRTFSADAPSAQVAEQVMAALQQGYAINLQTLDVGRQSITRAPCPPRNGHSQSLAGAINERGRSPSAMLHACAYRPSAGVPVRKLGHGSTAADLIALYGPIVTAEIARLRANRHHRVFAAFDTGLSYVQCQAHSDPDVFYCEAQSADSFPALAALLTPDRIARLHAAGFEDPGRAQNYSKTYRADHIDDASLARELLTLLYDVYGYYGANPLKVLNERPEKKSAGRPDAR
jgi:hypothetical protein